MPPARPKATYADVLAAPEHMVAEVLDGELFLFPRPGPRHLRASSRLGSVLGGPFDLGVGGPGGWVILDEPELHLADDILVPDLAGWRVERMPGLPEDAFFTTPPDWVCEVMSPSTAGYDRRRKVPRYARAGVGHLWLVDPDPRERSLEVLQRQGEHWLLLHVVGRDERVRAAPFDALELDLSLLWGPEPAPSVDAAPAPAP